MGKTKRILCFLVALIMILSIVPINSIVFAIGVETSESTENTQAETPSIVPSGTSSSGLPSATVKKLASETVTEYQIYNLANKTLTDGNGSLDPQVLMQFIAKDTATEAAKNQYADYTTDFFIKVEGLEQSTAGTGCYLIGNYGSFGWIAIPLDDINVKNTVYPVITPVGFNFTYVDICESVKDFKCGIYFTTEFLNANPDFKITLELGLSANADKAIAGEYIKVGDSYTYSATGLQTPTDFVVDSNVTGDTAKVEEVMSNTSLDKFIPVNVPDGAELVIKLTGVGDKITYDIAPFVKDTTTKVENLTEAIIFRIPVPASITESYVKLTHDDKYAGIYEVKGTENAKYIQVSSADFSKFALEPVSTAPVASVNGITYATFAEALTAANALTGDVTVEIYGKVEYADATASLTGAYDSITFIGMTDDAEISITRNGSNGYISGDGNDCVVNFKDLILSKPAGFYANDAGDMNVAFTVYRVGAVNYTSCKFPNGACAAGCPTTYTECTFQKSHDKYAVWAYGADVTINECVFDDDRGIKMYAEGAAKTTEVTVTNSDFSKLTSKPAIVATLGESITLSGNTYSDTGVLELEDNGSSNGITIDSEDEVTCVSDAYPNGCGVLVDGVIYRTVAEAAAVATEGDTVTLLHNSAETVELPEGVTLDTNGYTAENVTVKAPAYVAMIGEVGYETFAEALAAVKGETGKTIVLLADASISGQNALDALTGNTIDLNDKTLTVSGNSYFSNGTTTFTNGNIVVSGYASDSFFCGYTAGAVIVFDDVVITGDSYSTGCAVFNANYGKVEIKNSEITLSGDTTGGVIYGGSVVIDNTTINATNVCRGITNSVATVQNGTEFTFDGGETGLNNSSVTINDSTVVIKNATKRAVRLGNNTLALENGATLTATNCKEDIVKLDDSSNAVVKVDATSTLDAVDNTTSYVAQIGDVKYATLQAALDAAQDGDTVTLLVDVTEDINISQDNRSITFDGNSKTLTGKIRISGGVSYNAANPATNYIVIKNVTVQAVSGNDACIYTEDRATAGVYAYVHNVTIEGCNFVGADSTTRSSTTAIRQKDGGDWNWTIKNCTANDNLLHSLLQVNNVGGDKGLVVDGCTVVTKNGMNINYTHNIEVKNSNISVDGYVLRAGVSGKNEDPETFTFTNNVLNSNTEEIVVLRGGAAASEIVMTNNTATAPNSVHIKGNTAATVVNADANYWGEGLTAPKATVAVEVESYYADAERTNLVSNSATGSNGDAFTGKYTIWGQATVKAKESMVLELYCGDKLIATTTLVQLTPILTGEQKEVSWNFYINEEAEAADGYWDTVWVDGCPNLSELPDKVVLYLDGEKIDESEFHLNGPDGINKVYAAVSDANGKVTGFYTTVDAAIADAQANDTITLLADVDLGDVKLVIDKALTIDLNSKTIQGTNRKTFEVYANATFKNGTILNLSTDTGSRCVDTRVGGITLNLEKVTLDASNQYQSQTITIGGDAGTADNKVIVNITDSNIIGDDGHFGYAIMVFNPVVMTITDSEIYGAGAIDLKAASSSVGSVGSTVTIVNSHLEGMGTGVDSTYGVIVINDKDITVTMDENSSIKSTGNDEYVHVAIVRGQAANIYLELLGTIETVGKVVNGGKSDLTIVVKDANAVANLRANGYTVAENADGTYTATYIEPVAQIGEVKYATLKEAIAALKDGDTLTILAGEISEGTIKFPAALKNVTIKGENGTILKDMILMAYDGNTISYEGITFDGIVFDNSKIVVTGWRSNGVTLSDWTIKNCTFKNISSTDTTAAVHFNLAATEPVNGFTFTNNVIDNLTGGDKSGLYLQATGNVVIKDNVINNVAFRPYVVQITTDDGIADNFTVTGNTFSGSAAGRAQGLGNNSEGTDTVNLVVNNNIFKGITNAQQICYWNFNAETTTADMSKNYYDVDIIENPSAIYFNGSASSIYDLNDMGVFPIYKELNADGTINLDSEFTPDLTVYVAQVGEEKFATVLEALNYAIENGVTEVKILESARELMPTDVELMLKANLTITADKEVTISFYNEGTTYDFIINSNTEYGNFVFTVGENVSFVLEDRVIWLGYYGNNVDVVVNGTLSGSQLWVGADLTVNETGTAISSGEALVMRRGALLTVDGGKVDASYFNILSGSIDAKNGAVIDSGAFWIANTGAYASSEGAVSISIKDSTLTSSGNFKAVTDESINVTIDNSKVAFTDFDGYGASVVDAKTTVTITNLSEVSFKNVTNDGRIVISSDVDLTTANVLTNVEADDESKKVVYEDGKYVFVDRVVAEVNGVEYSTLASAIEALRANGGTLKLRDNIRGSITLNYPAEGAPTEITIDLNGFTITSAESTIFVADGYVVTIKDSSEAKTGKIVSTNAGGEAIAINRNGHVILESGYVYNDYCAVWLYNSTGNGTFVMNGGTIEVPNGGTGIIVGAGTVTINGGKVLCNKTPVTGGGWNSYIYANGTMIITGGEFLGTIGCAGTIAISGGTFSYCDDPNDGFNSAHLAAGYGTQTNDDGSITVVKLPVAAKIGDTEYETIEAALKAAKNDDTIVLLADCAMAEVVVLKDIALTIEGNYTITLNDKLKVLGETTLNITSALAGEVLLEDGAIIANSTINGSVYIQGNVTFRGKNTFVMMYDYGTAYTPNHQWTLEKGASLTLTSTDRYGFGYGDKITIVGSIADALTARETITDSAIVVNMYGGLVGMTNSSYADTNSKFEAKDAYIIFGVNGDKSFGNKPNNSNKNVYYYGNYEYIFTNSVVTANGFKFYEDNGNSVVVFTDSDLLVNGVFMTNDASSKFTFTNCIILSKATLNGNDDKNQNAGEMILIGTSLTYNAMFTNNGTIKLDANSCLTAPSIVGNGNIIIDLAGFTGTKTIINANMEGFTGTIEIINNDRATFESTETGVVVTVAIPEVPSATTNPVVLRPELVYGLSFSADSITPEQLEYFGDYFADFVITFNQDVTLDADGDVYLTGEYGDYGWISVPFDPITIKAGESIRIMEYAANLFSRPELQITYKDVVELVKNFNCGVYVSPEFAAANPNFKVSINLNMYDPADETETPIAVECVDKVTQQPTQTTFGNEDIKRVVASVIDAEGNETFYLTLAEAIAAAQDGETVKLYEDVDSVGTIDKAITINGNKFTLNGNILILADVTFDGVLSLTGNVKVTNGATLTIAKTANVTGATSFFGAGNDASYYGMANGDAANGTIVINGTLKAQQINANNGGNIVINSGATATFEIVCIENGDMGEAAGTMTVNGTLNTQRFNIFAGGIATVNAGGLVNSEQEFTSSDLANVISIWGGGELNINGGKVVCATVEHTEGRHSGVNVADGAINMTAGEFICGGNLVLSGKLSVTGGSADIASIESTGDIYLEGDATITTPTEGLSITAPAGYNVVYAAGVYSVEEKVIESLGFYGSSVVTTGILQMNIYLDPSNVYANGDNYYIVLTVDGVEVGRVNKADWSKDANGNYFVSVAVPARAMTDVISAQLYDIDGDLIKEYKDTVEAYATYILTYNLYSVELRTALVAMLNYGAEAQKVFGYKLDKLANANIDAYQNLVANIDTSMSTEDFEADYSKDFVFYTHTIEAGSSLALNLYYNNVYAGDAVIIDEANRANTKVTISYTNYDGEAITTVLTGDKLNFTAENTLKVSVTGLAASDIHTDVTVVVEVDGQVVSTVTDSIEAYCAYTTADMPEMEAVSKAIMAYGNATKAYFESLK